MATHGAASSSTVQRRTVQMASGDWFRLTGPAPSDELVGITPVLRVVGTTTFIQGSLDMPEDWDSNGADVTAKLKFSPEVTETDADQFTLDLDWSFVENGEDLDKTLSAEQATVTLNTPNHQAGFKSTQNFNLAQGDADNGYAGSAGGTFSFQLNISSLGDIGAGIDFIGMDLDYDSLY